MSAGPIDVNSTAMFTEPLTSNTATTETIDTFKAMGTGCDAIVVVDSSLTFTVATPMQTMTLRITPHAHGAINCTVSWSGASGSFVVTANGISPVASYAITNSGDFGSARVGQLSPVTNTITASNEGERDLVIDPPMISNSDFVITPTTQQTVAANTSTTYTVTFRPSAAGTRTGTAKFTSNDPVGAKTVNLTGVGTSAVIHVAGADFGLLVPGTTVSKPAAVTSTGGGALTVTGATLSGGSWFGFDDNGHGCSGTTCAFSATVPPELDYSVHCAPPVGMSGSQTATLTVASDTDAGGTNTATLTCQAGSPDISVSPTSLAYGSVTVAAPVTKSFTLTNPGTAPTTISGITVTGASGYTLSQTCATGCTLAPNSMTPLTIMLTYAPTATGSGNATVHVANNVAGKNPLDLAVTATAVAPQIMFPSSVDFGAIELGGSAMKTIAIGNTGGAPLHISGATVTPSDYAITTPATTPVPAGGSTSYVVTCTPTATGARNGTLTITSDSLTASPSVVSLTCTGKGGSLAANPTTVAFAPTPIHTTKTATFTLSNPGNLDVAVTMQTLTPSTVGYTFTPVMATIPAGGSQVITVTFAPNSASDGGAAKLDISGTWGTGHTAMISIPISGTALTNDINVIPSSLDFGSFEYDASSTRTFCISNMSGSTVHISSVDLSMVMPNAGDVKITGIVKQPCGGSGGSAVTIPADIAPGDSYTVTVVAKPVDHAGAISATATVVTTLAVDPTRTVTMTGVATTGLLAVTPASLMLDFGGVDVDTGAMKQTVQFKNTGDGPVTLSNFTATAHGAFTLTLPGTTTLQPMETLALDISYDPSMVAMDSFAISYAIQHSATQMMATLMVTGRGVDRVLDLPDAVVTAPDTFRNPGSKAPIVLVPVKNDGGAPLHIQMSMLDSTASWSLVDAGPITVAPGDTANLMVVFAPTMAGMVPDATLTITTDAGDPPDTTKVAMVTLKGLALAPDVMIGPQPIDLGFTAANQPLSIADLLTLTNMDATHGFDIAHLDVSGDMVFDVTDVPATLDPGAKATVGVTFTPTTDGDFSATISVFVDQDTQAASTTQITGHAVDVDVHGGGGCSTSGGGTGLLVLFAIGVVLRRRAALLAVLAPAIAHADDVELTVFAPTPQTAGSAFHTQSADVGASGDFTIEAVGSYASNPLVIESVKGGTSVATDHVVKNRTLFDLGGAFAFLGRYEVGVRVPMYTQSGDAFDPMMAAGMTGASGTALGDIVVDAKARLVRVPGFSLGVSGALALPTAKSGELVGSDKPEGEVLLLGTFTGVPRLTLSANAGAALRASTTAGFVAQKSGLAWGAAASYAITDDVSASLEAFGEYAGKSDGAMVTLTPAEALLGARFRLADSFGLGLAFGRGLTDGAGAPQLRGVVSLAYVASSRPARAHLVATHEEVVAEKDSDGDGIPDSRDKCPLEPEDKDMFEDDDGCPDLDNDGDGIPDSRDKCPLDPEDKDGFQDEDGCPDKDNDGDGIPDDQDKCPNVPEDKDGFQDLDGCPDLDNDGDGIPDDKDKCPNEPETINGYQDEDGCPDRGDSAVSLGPDRIDTLEPVKFSGKGLNVAASLNVLRQIGATLRAHPELVRVRLTVHVQPTKNEQKDQELSDVRAKAVKDWLIGYGIDEKRLDPRGFGGIKPLVPATSKGAAAINDRLELVIMERK